MQTQARQTRCIAFAGNPNVGKSTLFNALTGLHQHTGNWPGKTVTLAMGEYQYKAERYTLLDLPGCYSLISRSAEESVAVECICGEQPDCVAVVCDSTCLERTLGLALQIMELTDRVVVCVNLTDEADRKGIATDLDCLRKHLGVPVVATCIGDDEALARLRETLREVCDGFLVPHPIRTLGTQVQSWESLIGSSAAHSDSIAETFVRRAEQITQSAQSGYRGLRSKREERLDRLFAGKWGYPVLFLLLLGIFWLTIQGANVPSALLQSGFDRLGVLLRQGLTALQLPPWLLAPLLDGVYTTLCRVVAVMLPPMAIFFPLFTLLEDFGYLPRAAFLLDRQFARSGACGKQALTTCMGFGCNAVGVTGCRIIDSRRERLIATLTNSFIPCNGRFPTLILLITLFFTGNSLLGAGILTGIIALSVAVSLLVSRFLSNTLLRGEPSSFVLELPPYRRPQLGKVIVRSILDRTLFVLGRAVLVAAPAGLIIWVLGNVPSQDASWLGQLAAFLQPAGLLLGMNGALLLAFILGLPANELVIPVVLMIFTAGGQIGSEQSLPAVYTVLNAGGIDWKTALCTILFVLFHWPCSTTLLTIQKETGSLKWTLLSFALPTAVGILVCAGCNLLLRLF